jgi:hypothetical protein
MDQNPKSRVEQAVPQPGAAQQLSEREKEALEASGEVEHQDGKQKEKTAQKAQVHE